MRLVTRVTRVTGVTGTPTPVTLVTPVTIGALAGRDDRGVAVAARDSSLRLGWHGNGQPKCHSERSEESGSDNGTKRQSLLAGRSFDSANAPLRMTTTPYRIAGIIFNTRDV